MTKIALTEARLGAVMFGDENEGRCVECGASVEGVEPDARRYFCPECNQPAVYGVPELLLMGMIELVG